ncbi:Sporulation domain-containing protein [Legionella lansingensis]|uniref:Sporulation domain-containing protein n=1 Tax=Legionella lansingensis TaxID=45067 RepID=A0A0W0VVN1_9GAMM|nr:SPOR domain-containing protein [Legionella lansingensis]KTD23766.1 Sporulation domain-containing protein [Legionella lansingensis]SNV47417.1 Sporulation domain-containing protein [Legionella lansingensis]
MARDYGRGRQQGRQKNSGPKQFLWVLASFLCGYLTATVFDFTSLSSWVHKNILAEDEPAVQTKLVAKKEELPKPKFEFYTLLAKDHGPSPSGARPTLATPAKPGLPPQNPQVKPPIAPVIAAANNSSPGLAQAPVSEAKPVALPNRNKESYLVQMASFKSKQEAERLKALLTLKGFEVTIVAAPPQQGGWFRVILGPYPSKTEAEKVQIAVARSEHIKGIIRKANA